MLFHLEFVGFFHLFDEGVEVFAGDFLDFFALAADEGVVAVVGAVIFYLAADVTFHAVHFVNEVEFFHDLNDAVDGNGIEVDFVLLERDLSNFVGRKRAAGDCENFDHGHAWTGNFIAGVAERFFGKFCIAQHGIVAF